MKLGVIIFHSNIKSIYKDVWVTKCLDSMVNQTVTGLNYYEINYDGEDYSVLENYESINKKFYSVKLKNHAEAMNYILDMAFEDGCDYVFNTNLDDFYHKSRVEIQLNMMLSGDFDLIGTDFCYIKESDNGEDIIFMYRDMYKYVNSIGTELESGHNVITHPSVCYSRRVWDSGFRYDGDEIPKEDYKLWMRLNKSGYKLGILPHNLLYYRIHDKQISFK
jgi:hypothetical protein